MELRSGDEPFGAVDAGDGSCSLAVLRPDPRRVCRLRGSGSHDSTSTGRSRPTSPSTGIRFVTATCHGRWPLAAYQNVYAREPGSAEMPSAGRPFTAELITRLVAGGVLVAPIMLHTGVSSQERHERPYPERFRVPRQTARLVNAVHGWGGRVIAIGYNRRARPRDRRRPDGDGGGRRGMDEPRRDAERGIWTIDGLLTGLHEPESSHLEMLARRRRAAGCSTHSYAAAREHGYRWHEFGDSQLVLGDMPAARR